MAATVFNPKAARPKTGGKVDLLAGSQREEEEKLKAQVREKEAEQVRVALEDEVKSTVKKEYEEMTLEELNAVIREAYTRNGIHPEDCIPNYPRFREALLIKKEEARIQDIIDRQANPDKYQSAYAHK
jgi:hypothetical protein